ncbi:MAG: hypothetical protein LUE92_07370 [Clostridiales bacterium]|nr:hypothetical protein [Clostridiales bacterium]
MKTMKEIRDQFVQAIENHNPGMVPLTKKYRATENNFPVSIGFMTTFRTINKIKATPYYVEDPKKKQFGVFFGGGRRWKRC